MEINSTLLLLGATIVMVLFVEFIKYKMSPKYEKISFKEILELTNMPIITFKNNGNKIHFLLDTGATYSNINKDCLKGYTYEKSENQGQTIGIEGNLTETVNYINMNLEYKDVIYNEEFMPVDLNSAFNYVKEEKGIQLMGILGVSFFEKYKYVLDFKEMVAYSKL